MSEDYELQITLRSPEHENDRGYMNRETLADAKLLVTSDRGWEIYLNAIEKSLLPTCVIVKES